MGIPKNPEAPPGLTGGRFAWVLILVDECRETPSRHLER